MPGNSDFDRTPPLPALMDHTIVLLLLSNGSDEIVAILRLGAGLDGRGALCRMGNQLACAPQPSTADGAKRALIRLIGD